MDSKSEPPSRAFTELQLLERKVQVLQRINDDLRRNEFQAMQRAHQLAFDMGFQSIEEAESTVPKLLAGVSVKELALMVESLQDELTARSVSSDEVKTLRQENTRLQSQIAALEAVAGQTLSSRQTFSSSKDAPSPVHAMVDSGDKENSPLQDSSIRNVTPQHHSSAIDDSVPSSTFEQPPTSHASETVQLQLEIRELRKKYDTLLQVKERESARYQADYTEWKEFNKLWIKRRRTKASRRKDTPIAQRNCVSADEDKNVSAIKTEPSASETVLKVEGDSNTPALRREDSETVFLNALPSFLRSPPSTPSKSLKRKRSRSSPHTPQKESSDTEPEDDSQDILVPSRQPVTSVVLGKLPEVSNAARHYNDFASPGETTVTSSPTVVGDIDVLQSSPCKHGLSDYSTFKGRGRYAQELQQGDNTINANFEIDASRNNGLTYRFDDVVRSKERRKHLDAGDCECCHDYYEAIGPLPARLDRPLWRSPVSTPQKPRMHVAGSSAHDHDHDHAVLEHKKAISRHRQQWESSVTPPGYWDIGFPNTQQAVAINERAEKIHQEKQAKVDEEAGASGGGRYKKRGRT